MIKTPTAPIIQELHVQNYRVLANVRLDDLGPLNVILGPNGCGKSTLFDVFGFLEDCLRFGVRKALEPRGRLTQLRSRGRTGPVRISLKYREARISSGGRRSPLITYHLAIDETDGKAAVVEEYLQWNRRGRGRPFRFLNIQKGEGEVVSGDEPEESDRRQPVRLESPDLLAISALGQLADNPRVVSFRKFIENWFLSYFVPEQAHVTPRSGAAERLTRTGDNLANVVQCLHEDHPRLLDTILKRLKTRIPGLDGVEVHPTLDNRLVLQFRDRPFREPFLARNVSDGTLKMLAYLILLNQPGAPPLLCIEEPENGLHPKLLYTLAEEFRAAAGRTQVIVSSHSPYLVDAVRPQEVWVMERGSDGFSTAQRADHIQGVPEFIREGATLGALWMENQFRKGNP